MHALIERGPDGEGYRSGGFVAESWRLAEESDCLSKVSESVLPNS